MPPNEPTPVLTPEQRDYLAVQVNAQPGFTFEDASVSGIGKLNLQFDPPPNPRITGFNMSIKGAQRDWLKTAIPNEDFKSVAADAVEYMLQHWK